jgi:hypothetical protein
MNRLFTPIIACLTVCFAETGTSGEVLYNFTYQPPEVFALQGSQYGPFTQERDFAVFLPAPRYTIDYDVRVDSLPLGSFAPEAFSVVFETADSKTSFQLRGGGYFGIDGLGAAAQEVLGSSGYGGFTDPAIRLWADNVWMHVSGHIDLVNRSWQVFLNGNLLKPFPNFDPWPILTTPTNSLTKVSFVLQHGPFGDSRVELGSVRIVADVPEPRSSLMLLVAVVLFTSGIIVRKL